MSVLTMKQPQDDYSTVTIRKKERLSSVHDLRHSANKEQICKRMSAMFFPSFSHPDLMGNFLFLACPHPISYNGKRGPKR